MKIQLLKFVAISTILVVAITACSFPFGNSPATGGDQSQAQIEATVSARLTQIAFDALKTQMMQQAMVTSTPIATSTPAPTVTQVIPIIDSPGSSMQPGATEEISDWWGVIKSNPPGAQFDDYFERRDLSQTINYGIDSMDPVIKAKIKEVRDSGQVVHLYGTLFSNVPDVNGSQIQVDRIE